MSLLNVNDLSVSFVTRNGTTHAVQNVSFTVDPKSITAIIGESGSGKSVSCYALLGLIPQPPGRIDSGTAEFEGRDLLQLSERELRGIRGSDIAMIFQDPMMTLNPVLRIETQMIEAIQAHEGGVSREDARIRSRDTLGLVGISSPDERLRAYPHQFSGGMRQRVSIAIAMLNRPDLIIADEPTTALDVTIQGQVISEMQKLCRETQTALLWITHDLAVVAGIADRVCVMYAGRIVEQGLVADIIANPMHPYTQGLMGSVPSQNQRGKPLQQINGMVPSMLSLPRGCAFQNRCSYVTEKCSIERPDITHLSDERQVRCFNVSGAPKP